MKTESVSIINPEIEKFGQQMLACIYEALLGDGHIDPEGKSEEQIMTEVRQAALRWSNHRPMMWSTDFRQDLLQRARSLKRSKKDHESILYYATWFEHWVNGVLLRNIRSLTERESSQMIRDVGIRGKFTWLLLVIHKKRISQRHLKTILQVCDLRNEFVHYKYKMFDIDGREEDKKLKEALKMAEKAVRYLQTFEVKNFFKGSARSLLKKLRSTQNQK